MTNSDKILIFVLTSAAMLVLYLYSPNGSTDLYNKMNYYTTNQGVNFTNIKIKNLPRNRGLNASNYGYDQSIFEMNSSNYLKASNLLANNSTRNSVYVSNGGYYKSNNSYSVNSNKLSRGNNEKNGINGIGNGCSNTTGITKNPKINIENDLQRLNTESIDLYVFKKSVIQKPASTEAQNESSILAEVTLTDVSSSTPQKASTDWVDPGSDPLPDPIPVGDGTTILIILIITYSISKIYIVRYHKKAKQIISIY